MSRRKQSHPKPLKRKTEDALEEVAELHHLPSDTLLLREPEDESQEFTIFSKVSLREGAIFGPYSGHLIRSEDEEEEESESPVNCIETKDVSGKSVRLGLTESSGGWLKLLRTSQEKEISNIAFSFEENEVWCCVTSHIEPDTELLAHPRIIDSSVKSSERPSPSSPHFNRFKSKPVKSRTIKKEEGSSPEPENNEVRVKNEEDALLGHSRSVSPEANKSSPRSPQHGDRNSITLYNGTCCNEDLKYEVSSPNSESPSSSDRYPAETSNATFMNGCSFPVLPYGYSSSTFTDGVYHCATCDVRFNSRGTLQAHQLYYCTQRSSLSTAPSNIDNDNTSKSDQVSTVSPPIESIENKRTSITHKRTVESQNNDTTSMKFLKLGANDEGGVSSAERRFPRPQRLYKCQYCNYASDKKGSLTRHERMHNSSPMCQDSSNVQPEIPMTTPPLARYCANCDIQFASFKNYQVHKQFYCNTRHVHKSVTSSPPQHQHLLPSGQPSPAEKLIPTATLDSSSKPLNMVLNQPLYAAISTSPLILVPCSYVAGGGLSPAAGLIPAGNIIIPGNSALPPTEGGNSSQAHNVIPTYTVMPGAGPGRPNEMSNRGEVLSSPQLSSDAEDPPTPRIKKILSEKTSFAKETTAVGFNAGSPKFKNPSLKSDHEPEKPLDLSFRKKEATRKQEEFKHPLMLSDGSPLQVAHSSTFSKISSINSSNKTEESLALTPPISCQSLPLIPIINSGLDIVASSLPIHSQNDVIEAVTNSIGTVTNVTPPMLMKQGTSKCKHCNIVFYKYENYLAHKTLYCASRVRNVQDIAPSENQINADGDTSDKDEAVERKSGSPTSPKLSNMKTSPGSLDPSENQNHSSPNQQTVFQFYCMACGIKFTSIDNLTAHQTYYCPKRETVVNKAIGISPALRAQEYRCTKCKNIYPTEESLKHHPCVVQRKCPYCDVFCPTLSAAQRHLVTHTGVKSFRCSLCGYKGHTLRGMRTHIRIHLDKSNTTPEEAYILCMDEAGTEIGNTSRKTSGRPSAERISNAVATETSTSESLPTTSSSLAHLPPEVLSKKSLLDTHNENMSSTDITHWCQICGYSSSYKGNVVRHVKLVHKDLIPTQSMSSIVLSRPSVSPIEVASSKNMQDTSETSNQSDFNEQSESLPTLETKPLSLVNGSIKTDQFQHKGDDSLPKPRSTSPNQASGAKGLRRTPVLEDQPSSSSSPNVLSMSKTGLKYCKSCDISFNYLSNFIAHKKFYCSPKPSETSEPETTSVQ